MSPAYDIHPALATMTVILPSNFAFILPIATPASALAYSSRFLTLKEMIWSGSLLSLFGIGLFFNPASFLLANDGLSIKKTVNSVNPLQPTDLKKKLDSKEDIFLLDVRQPWEFSLAAIKGSENFPQGEVVDLSLIHI